MDIRGQIASTRMIKRPFHRAQFLIDIQFLARLQQEHFHSMAGQNVGCHTPGGA
jgi:hypothetical protein